MCGIAGFLAPAGQCDDEALRRDAVRMTDRLVHRGQDASGTFTDAASGIALGHRRLSIQDLSDAGAQPMTLDALTLVYNGEIYNFRELQRELSDRGHAFRGHSDTEVLLVAIREWGIERALERVRGMFAFAVWDSQRRVLHLARDRVGKKPLYYGRCGDTFLFASELKALRAHPGFRAEIDRDALGLMIRNTWVPSPHSIFEGIRKLPAGTHVEVRAAGTSEPQTYWSALEVAEAGQRAPFGGDMAEAVAALDALLRDAVSGRMIADVPLGALLSGGIDSSLVVSLMQAQASRPVRTFSIGFREPEFDEAGYARAVASHLGTEHHELYVTSKNALELIPRLPTLYDEPFADSSQLPTFLVSELARSEVTVALSGDGGDELFAGYSRYFACLRRWKRWSRWPLALRAVAGGAMRGLALACSLAPPGRTASPSRLRKRAFELAGADPLALFTRLSARCPAPDDFVLDARGADPERASRERCASIREPLQAMMCLEFLGSLADDILVKVDRASMGVSLEVRSPLLDHRVVEFAWSLPISLRVGPEGGKRVLRELLARYVPRELSDRPKRGFNVPISAWLRDPLRDWAEALLDEKRLSEQGLFRTGAVRRLWREHRDGAHDHHNLLWSILMFQAWWERGDAG
jgi:asparagine synthase (glutamine-hydrolysing)